MNSNIVTVTESAQVAPTITYNVYAPDGTPAQLGITTLAQAVNLANSLGTGYYVDLEPGDVLQYTVQPPPPPTPTNYIWMVLWTSPGYVGTQTTTATATTAAGADAQVMASFPSATIISTSNLGAA